MLFATMPFVRGEFVWRHELIVLGILAVLVMLVGVVCIVARNLKERRIREASQRDLPTIIEVESNPAFEPVKP